MVKESLGTLAFKGKLFGLQTIDKCINISTKELLKHIICIVIKYFVQLARALKLNKSVLYAIQSYMKTKKNYLKVFRFKHLAYQGYTRALRPMLGPTQFSECLYPHTYKSEVAWRHPNINNLLDAAILQEKVQQRRHSFLTGIMG